MNNLIKIRSRILSISIACCVGYLFALIDIDPSSRFDSIFFLISMLCFVATDYFFLEQKRRTSSLTPEIARRSVAALIPSIIAAFLITVEAGVGIFFAYIMLGIFQELLLNGKDDPPVQKNKREKITALFISIGSVYILFIVAFTIISIIGYFNGLNEIEHLPPLVAGPRLARIQWIIQFTCIAIAFYFVRIQRNETNKYFIDMVTGVHFTHILLTTIWSFTLTSLDSYLIGLSTLIFMTCLLGWFAYLTKSVSKNAIHLILPAIMGRMFNAYALITVIILNPDRWNAI